VGQVVFACGAALRDFFPCLREPIVLVRGQVLSTEPLPSLFRPGMAVDWGTVYWRQDADGAIVLGGLRRLDPDGETGPEPRLNECIQRALEGFLPAAFPGFPPVRVARRWAGVMDQTPDGRPLVGAVPGAARQWVVAGFGGHGLPAALGAGHAIAEAVATGRAPDWLRPYDPARVLRGGVPCR
jgi:sarcosine oxidase subunit beta